MPLDRSAFVRDLSIWFRSSQRDLPWRQPENFRDPYRILISEVMLQQTTVAAVIPYFNKFIARFPTIQDLAAAPEEDVLAHWAGLGYYARARNLQKCAREVVGTHSGQFPTELQQILQLPGVGRYTAGAVSSIAYDLRAPIVDANVARVLSRVCLIEGDLKTTANQNRLWDEAEKLVQEPAAIPSELNPALMELGALICTPKKPRCELCPVSAECQAFTAGRQEELPFIPPRKEFTPVYDVCAFASRENGSGVPQVLMRRRPDVPGLWWRGMWELPRITCKTGQQPEDALAALGQEIGVELEIGTKLTTLKHGVTRFAITLDCFEVTTSGIGNIEPAADANWGWFSWPEALALPIPSTMKRLLKLLTHRPAKQLSLL